MKEECIEAGVLLFLAIHTWTDIRTREINIYLTIGMLLAGLPILFWRADWLSMWVILGISFFLTAFSFLSKDAIGLGDILVVTAAGLASGMDQYLYMLCLGLVLASFWSLYLLVIRRRNRKEEIPFVPFLLLGYIGGLLLC